MLHRAGTTAPPMRAEAAPAERYSWQRVPTLKARALGARGAEASTIAVRRAAAACERTRSANAATTAVPQSSTDGGVSVRPCTRGTCDEHAAQREGTAGTHSSGDGVCRRIRAQKAQLVLAVRRAIEVIACARAVSERGADRLDKRHTGGAGVSGMAHELDRLARRHASERSGKARAIHRAAHERAPDEAVGHRDAAARIERRSSARLLGDLHQERALRIRQPMCARDGTLRASTRLLTHTHTHRLTD